MQDVGEADPLVPMRWWHVGGPTATTTLLLTQCTAIGTLLLSALWALWPTPGATRSLALVALSGIGAIALLAITPTDQVSTPGSAYWLATAALALLAVTGVRRVARLTLTTRTLRPLTGWLTAAIFGAWALLFWELLVTGFAVPRVLLPSPSAIALALWEHAGTLGGDLVQTVFKAVLAGYMLGSGLGVLTGIAIDRLPLLQRGLLPVASLSSTVPLVGVAPIAVMWFGFDWPSKAAVVTLMTFFPALVSTLAGLQATGKLERELMHAYAAGYQRTLLSLRLPVALPFIFNALKVNATLALIGAIVAEFFGSPTVGLGFRISTEAARLNMPLVWAAIVVASVVGSLLFALLAALERRVNFWHPSVRVAR
ncbi:MAG TPA: ABC transporter permease [Candidatus Aquabacterium excrementipullorum]|nr:ABC transporter permease [Candidatus Aquabacterium excrementipullorum]